MEDSSSRNFIMTHNHFLMTNIIIIVIMIMIRNYQTDSVSSHHPELVDVPVREVRLVQDCHLLVTKMMRMMRMMRRMITISTKLMNMQPECPHSRQALCHKANSDHISLFLSQYTCS